MRISAKSQFNIGEIVKFKGASTRIIIGGINVETCPGGMQIHYSGVVLASSIYGTKEGQAVAEKVVSVNEIYLEKLPPAPPPTRIELKNKAVRERANTVLAGMKYTGRAK